MTQACRTTWGQTRLVGPTLWGHLPRIPILWVCLLSSSIFHLLTSSWTSQVVSSDSWRQAWCCHLHWLSASCQRSLLLISCWGYLRLRTQMHQWLILTPIHRNRHRSVRCQDQRNASSLDLMTHRCHWSLVHVCRFSTSNPESRARLCHCQRRRTDWSFRKCQRRSGRCDGVRRLWSEKCAWTLSTRASCLLNSRVREEGDHLLGSRLGRKMILELADEVSWPRRACSLALQTGSDHTLLSCLSLAWAWSDSSYTPAQERCSYSDEAVFTSQTSAKWRCCLASQSELRNSASCHRTQ